MHLSLGSYLWRALIPTTPRPLGLRARPLTLASEYASAHHDADARKCPTQPGIPQIWVKKILGGAKLLGFPRFNCYQLMTNNSRTVLGLIGWGLTGHLQMIRFRLRDAGWLAVLPGSASTSSGEAIFNPGCRCWSMNDWACYYLSQIYTTYGIWCHVHNSVTYPILRRNTRLHQWPTTSSSMSLHNTWLLKCANWYIATSIFNNVMSGMVVLDNGLRVFD